MTTAKLQIGPHPVNGQAVLAPMAGLTDQPFRSICRRFGAALAVTEMTTSDVTLWQTEKSRQRLMLTSENGLKIVQIAGADADWQQISRLKHCTRRFQCIRVSE